MKDINESINDLNDSIINVFGEEEGNKLFQETIFPTLKFRIDAKAIKDDIASYKVLFMNVIIPQSRQFYIDSLKLESTLSSIDKEYISIKENEILQLAYVGLYHKIENYENKILIRFNELSGTNYKSLDKIGIDHSKKELFNDRDRIRLICNSIKHNDSYPKKQLLTYYPEMELKMKISNNHLNFEKDIDHILAYVLFFNMFISVKILEVHLRKIDLLYFQILKNETNNFLDFLSIVESYKDPKFERAYLNKKNIDNIG